MADLGVTPFIHIITSYPTVIFSFLLGLSLLYWLCASLGLFDIHLGDLTDQQHALDHSGHHQGTAEGMAGLLAKLGLNGVPLTLIISLISAVGWLLSFYSCYWLTPILPAAFSLLTNTLILLASFYLATWATAYLIRPLRPFFQKAHLSGEKILTGQTAIVRSLRVNADFGEAELIDGGASIIVKVRALDGATYSRGDKVVLLENISHEYYYTIISETEFISGSR
jgi:hypothetical protein